MAKFLYLNSRKFMIGILSPPLPPDQAGHTRNEQEAEDADEGGGKPVILFPLIEHDLHAAHSDRQQPEADVVQFPEIGTIGFDPGWILDQAADQKEGEYADGQIDVEDPSPRVVVGDPTADRRSEGWRKHGDETIEREGLASFPWFERIRHDGLRHRLEAATSDALKDTCKEQDRECRRDTAKKACSGEDGDAKQKEILAADDTRRPCANRQNDRVGDEIAGENPGSLTGAGTEVAGNVRKGDICDGGIENLHEGSQSNRRRDQPGVGLRLPLLAATDLCDHPLPSSTEQPGSFLDHGRNPTESIHCHVNCQRRRVHYKDILYLNSYCM